MSKKVVVVDDDQDILMLFKWILEEEGYTVMPYEQAPELKDICMYDPHIIITDEWLPIKKGHQLCKELKSNVATRHIPIILTSAFTNIHTIAKRCKADGYVAKPFDIETLVDIVKQYA